jgi:hypothetical protein
LLTAQAVAGSRSDRADTFSFFQKENLACTKRKSNQTFIKFERTGLIQNNKPCFFSQVFKTFLKKSC